MRPTWRLVMTMTPLHLMYIQDPTIKAKRQEVKFRLTTFLFARYILALRVH